MLAKIIDMDVFLLCMVIFGLSFEYVVSFFHLHPCVCGFILGVWTSSCGTCEILLVTRFYDLSTNSPCCLDAHRYHRRRFFNGVAFDSVFSPALELLSWGTDTPFVCRNIFILGCSIYFLCCLYLIRYRRYWRCRIIEALVWCCTAFFDVHWCDKTCDTWMYCCDDMCGITRIHLLSVAQYIFPQKVYQSPSWKLDSARCLLLFSYSKISTML